MKVNQPHSLREQIVSNHRKHAVYTAIDAVVVANSIYWSFTFTGTVWVVLLTLTASLFAGSTTANTIGFLRTGSALKTYDSNPIAAYIAEIKHTFGI